MPNLSWPTAFVLVFGGLPAFVFSVAVLCTYPVVTLPLLGTVVIGILLGRRQARYERLAMRADLHFPHHLALVAQPLPDMPTVPMRRMVRP